MSSNEGGSSLTLETPGMLPRQRQEAVGRPLSPPYLVPTPHCSS